MIKRKIDIMSNSNITYSIAPEIFEMFPGYVRGVVIARGVQNGPSPEELIALLRQAEEEARSKLDLESLIDKYCGGKSDHEILTQENNRISIGEVTR